jgi:hypothetical protein
MAQSAQPAKVLRVGIIRDGKIEVERVLKPGETATIGPSPKSMFVQQVELPKPEFPLFEARGGKYYLRFTASMKGKIGAAGAVVGLEKLIADPSVERDGEVFAWALSEEDRGKVSVDNVTVLFQFVTPPPVVAVRPTRTDFRPRLVEEDDALLFGFMLLFGALGAIFMVWAAYTDFKVEEPTSIQQLDPKWTKLIISKPEPPEVPKTPTDDGTGDDKPKDAEKPAEPSEDASKDKPQGDAKAPVSDSERKEQARAGALAKSKTLGFLVTRGESLGGTAVDRFADGGISEVGGSLRGVSAVTEGDARGSGVRGTGDQVGEDVKIGSVKQAGGGSTNVQAAAAIAVSVEVGAGEVDDPSGTDANAVKSTVTRNSGQLKYCYEQRLKSNPSLAGRVEIEWMISGGKVTAASVFTNTTGDDEFAQCIITKIKRWSFDSSLEGEVTWPFIFHQKQ